MKTKFTLLRTSLLAVLLFASTGSFAAIRYICSGTTFTLNVGIPPSGITYTWDVKGPDNLSIAGYPKATPPTALPATEGSYKVILISTGSGTVCSSDPVTTDFVVLPALPTPTVAANNAAYCGAATAANSDITVTFTFPTTYATDLEAEYTYEVTKNGTAVTAGTYGAVTATGYKLTTTEIGTYKIKTTVKYKLKTGSTNLLASLSGCPATSTEVTVEVTAAPSAPTITFTLTP